MPNHTSDQHPWFVESASSRDSAKRDWYVWRDPAPDGGPPNNWRSAFRVVGPAWTFHEPTGQYYLHSFTPHQPDLNWDNPAVEAAMHDVLRFWLDRGADGFRIDVVYELAKDPELRDNEPCLRHDQDWPTIHDRLRRIRAVVEDYDGRAAPRPGGRHDDLRAARHPVPVLRAGTRAARCRDTAGPGGGRGRQGPGAGADAVAAAVPDRTGRRLHHRGTLAPRRRRRRTPVRAGAGEGPDVDARVRAASCGCARANPRCSPARRSR